MKRVGLYITAIASFLASVGTASADLVVPSLEYRTGPYAAGGVPYSDGFADYLTLLNERDGGINGVPIRMESCEFGYDTKAGVECFNKTLEAGGKVFHPMSTGLVYELIEPATKAGVVLHTMGYGVTASADGTRFSNVFNFPAHYWHAASTQIRYLKEMAGGSLEGKRIMHIHHNSGYGREPNSTLEVLAQREGFTLDLQPVDHPGEDQDALWESIAANPPDYILFWGWGVMNKVALENALRIKFPLDHMMAVWWSANERDLKPLGRRADGLLAVNFHESGDNFRIFNDLNELVYQTGKGRGNMDNIGQLLYNRGLVSAMYATEALRLAMETNKTDDPTAEMVRDAYEQLDMSDARFDALGMESFLPGGSAVTCADHDGKGLVAVNKWNARRRMWERVSDYYEPDEDLIGPQVEAAAKAFAEEHNLPVRDCNGE